LERPSFDLAIVLSIIFATAFAAFFAVVASTLYQRWQTRQQDLKGQLRDDNAEAVGIVKKPELSGNSAVMVHEMDGQREPQELSERIEGLPHEMSDDSLHQELPGSKEGLPHELPGEVILP
jgi:hypothetical protein